jgi:hypothetical protein
VEFLEKNHETLVIHSQMLRLYLLVDMKCSYLWKQEKYSYKKVEMATGIKTAKRKDIKTEMA